MVKIHCYMSRTDTEVAVGVGASFAQAAKDLKNRVAKCRPSLLLLDFEAAVKAVQNEHSCMCVVTGSKYGEFNIERRNLYRESLSLWDKIRLYFTT